MTAPDHFIIFDHWDFFKLSHKPNKNIPFIADCLALTTTQRLGRRIITKESLSVGDIVAIEEPLFHIINPMSYFERCFNCLKTNKLNLIPCHECPFGKFVD